MSDNLVQDLTAALDAIPLIDPHSHIEPLSPVSKSLDDILGYHYYTELAHSAGMGQGVLSQDVSPRDRVREIIKNMSRFDNTAQAAWFVEIAQKFLGHTKDTVTADDAEALFDKSVAVFSQPDWETQVFQKTNLEKIFLTNEFDDPLTGFDTTKYVPCLRTDTLVFHLDKPETRDRIAKATGITVVDASTLRKAIWKLFAHFKAKGAKACAISLPPDFSPLQVTEGDLDRALPAVLKPDLLNRGVFEAMQLAKNVIGGTPEASPKTTVSMGVFQMLAEHCREFGLPFDLMIGVNRKVYEKGVYQGQDLFDRRGSLIQYKELFNRFPEVTFPISVLTSGQNQELVAYSWIFPNVTTNGHWWYSNIPSYIERDLRERLQAVPKTKQIGYYSDAYKLEFVLPKFGMYRRILAKVLADEFVRSGRLTETGAVALGQRLLRDNIREMFQV
ncbi:MAG: glucuronate isomerase [Fimbriiglobus sp.]